MIVRLDLAECDRCFLGTALARDILRDTSKLRLLVSDMVEERAPILDGEGDEAEKQEAVDRILRTLLRFFDSKLDEVASVGSDRLLVSRER